MRQHLYRVTRGADAFGALIRAMHEVGERVGWLDLDAASFKDLSLKDQSLEDLPQLPAELETAAAQGVLRAVAVGGGRSVAVKPMRGAPVLKDLLREHFRGCMLVLVRTVQADRSKAGISTAEWPGLEPHDERWRLEIEGEPGRILDTDQLIAALRKPRPLRRRSAASSYAPEPAPEGDAAKRRTKR